MKSIRKYLKESLLDDDDTLFSQYNIKDIVENWIESQEGIEIYDNMGEPGLETLNIDIDASGKCLVSCANVNFTGVTELTNGMFEWDYVEQAMYIQESNVDLTDLKVTANDLEIIRNSKIKNTDFLKNCKINHHLSFEDCPNLTNVNVYNANPEILHVSSCNVMRKIDFSQSQKTKYLSVLWADKLKTIKFNGELDGLDMHFCNSPTLENLKSVKNSAIFVHNKWKKIPYIGETIQHLEIGAIRAEKLESLEGLPFVTDTFILQGEFEKMKSLDGLRGNVNKITLNDTQFKRDDIPETMKFKKFSYG